MRDAGSAARLAGPALVALAFLALWPALGAGWIWDDDMYVLANPAVLRPGGWLHAWVPGSTPQWYPLVFASFAAQHAVHGLEPFGYHLVNVLLHAVSAWMLWRLLVRIGLPGAWLAAALFAVHPIQVESVAWVTERKNVLSMAFALGSMHAWLAFLGREPGAARARAWWVAFALYACALLSKTTAVAVPVAMVAVAWWRPALAGAAGGLAMRGRTWRAVAPFFALGIAMGLATAWLEATHVGAGAGAEFARTPLDRLLGAARAWWWYLGAWAWPVQSCFVQPPADPAAWRGWAALGSGFAVAVAAAIAARRGARGPLAAFLCYSAGVFPALGFFNLYPLRYAPVADHFAYVGTVALAAATGWGAATLWARLASRLPDAARAARAAGAVAAVGLAGLAAQSFAHAMSFRDAETLWRATLDANPRAWLASSNLSAMLLARVQEAIDAGDATARDALLGEADALARSALAEAAEFDFGVHANLSEVLRLQGREVEALVAMDAAIALEPAAGSLRWQRGRLLEALGRLPEACASYAEAVAREPGARVHHAELVRACARAGDVARARDAAAAMAARWPGDSEALGNLGSLELALGDAVTARVHLRSALDAAARPGAAPSTAAAIASRLVQALRAEPTDAALEAEAGRIEAAFPSAGQGAAIP
jgi:tetratricopeptide (TPR) repeat protein